MEGIAKFKEYFAGYESNYVVIGGAACGTDRTAERCTDVCGDGSNGHAEQRCVASNRDTWCSGRGSAGTIAGGDCKRNVKRKFTKSGIHSCVCHFFFVTLQPIWIRSLFRTEKHIKINKIFIKIKQFLCG